MDVPNIAEFGRAWWDQARKKMKNSLVYLDAVTCECLHWNGGVASIFEAGATAIRELSAFEVVPKSAKKAVFIANGPFHGTSYKVLKSLIKPSNLEYCVIITTANAGVHDILRGGRESSEYESYHIMEEDVLKWMGNLNYTVEIFNYPLSTIHPSRESFLIPSAKSAAPFLISDLNFINEKLMQSHNKVDGMTVRSINDLQYLNLPLSSQSEVRQLICNLNQVLQHMNAKEEIFTVGSYSRIVGTELEALGSAKLRRKNASLKVSVIIVDRLLDLVGATQLSSENLFDRLMHRLDRFSEQSSDVTFSIKKDSKSDYTRAPGSLAPESNWEKAMDVMQQLIHKPAVQASEKIAHQTATMNHDDWDFIEKDTHLYQVSLAISRANESSKAQHVDNLESIQKELCLSLEDKQSPSPLVQILQLMKAKKDATLEDILLLMVHLYSLSGDEETFTAELEDRFKSLLAENLVSESDNLSEELQDFVGVPIDEVKAHRAAQKIVEHLHAISQSRNTMKKYKSLQHRLIPSSPMQYNHLFRQLIDDIFDPHVVDNPDVEHKSAGLKDLLKTGFSLFVNVRKPKASDNAVMLFYVCGGIRPDEMKLIRDAVEMKSPSHRVIVGSSHFIAAHDMLHYVLRSNQF